MLCSVYALWAALINCISDYFILNSFLLHFEHNGKVQRRGTDPQLQVKYVHKCNIVISSYFLIMFKNVIFVIVVLKYLQEMF